MSEAPGRWLPVGRVGRPHGRDGSFYVDAPGHGLAEGTTLRLSERELTVERRAGTDEHPLVRLGGVADREAAAAVRGQPLLAWTAEAALAEDEWLAVDLLGCEIAGLGSVRRVVSGPSCDVLEVGEGAVLVPFVSDAIVSVDPAARVIEVDRRFLGLEQDAPDGRP